MYRTVSLVLHGHRAKTQEDGKVLQSGTGLSVTIPFKVNDCPDHLSFLAFLLPPVALCSGKMRAGVELPGWKVTLSSQNSSVASYISFPA